MAPEPTIPKSKPRTATVLVKLPPGIFWIIAFAIVVSLGCTAWLVFTSKSDAVKYALVGALMCFACALITGLILAGRAEIKGESLGIIVSISGPAVVWIAAFCIFRWAAPFPDYDKSLLEKIQQARQQDVDWKTYEDWKRKQMFLFTDSQAVKSSTDHFVRTALDFAYDPQSKKDKIQEGIIETAFVYIRTNQPSNAVWSVKLQRIKGKRTDGGIEIYQVARPTLDQASTDSILYEITTDGLIPTTGNKHQVGDGAWYPSANSLVDYLLVGFYPPPGHPANGDFCGLDVPKYCDNDIEVKFAIVCNQAFQDKDPKMWQVRGEQYFLKMDEQKTVPIRFKETEEPMEELKGTTFKPKLGCFADLARMLDDRYAILNKGASTNAESILLKRIYLAMKMNEQMSLVSMFNGDVKSHVYFYQSKKQENALVATYKWALPYNPPGD